MKHKEYLFPGKNLKLVKRHAVDEFIMMTEAYAKLLLSGGRSAFRGACYPNQNTFYTAVSRLRSSGLLVSRPTSTATPSLQLTEPGRDRIRELTHPERLWKRKWDRVWYLLSYDVPECDRSYRDVLRRFLQQLRFGYLHQSLWITPDDRRPEFQDLCDGAAVGSFAFMFAAQVVNNTPPRLLVQQAWDWDRLEERQRIYCDVASHNKDQVAKGTMNATTAAQLAREEMQAYMYAMQLDPLLPRALLPAGYQGREVVKLHRHFVKTITRLDY